VEGFGAFTVWTLAVCLSGNVLVSMASTKLLYIGPVGTWTGDRLRAGKSTWYVTSHSGQLSLAILLWVGVMSTSKSWGANMHTT